jgi:protein gp37
MLTPSTIEWTEATWNPTTGCTKISPGCKNCYADRLAKRLRAMGNPKYQRGFTLTLHEDTLDLPQRLKSSRIIFVNSMSDLFHEAVPLAFIQRVFTMMRQTPQHTYQILTKRAVRLEELAPEIDWPTNVWMGVSVENSDYRWRIDHLRRIPAAVRFLSIEPLLGPIANLDLEQIHWVIVGGESGPRARPIDADWVRVIRERCRARQVAFFFKQWGGVQKSRTGRSLDGRTWDEMPIQTRKGQANSWAPEMLL